MGHCGGPTVASGGRGSTGPRWSPSGLSERLGAAEKTRKRKRLGSQRRAGWSFRASIWVQEPSGPRLVTFFAVLYYAGLRPEEAVNLRRENITLPPLTLS